MVTKVKHSVSFIRVFRKLTKLAIMAILASEALLLEKYPVAKCHQRWE